MIFPKELFDYNERLKAYVQDFDGDVLLASKWKDAMRDKYPDTSFEQRNSRILMTMQEELQTTSSDSSRVHMPRVL